MISLSTKPNINFWLIELYLKKAYKIENAFHFSVRELLQNFLNDKFNSKQRLKINNQNNIFTV